jgi:hypothetical protein
MMLLRPELAFTYDAAMRPIAAKCTACTEKMPAAPLDLRDAVEVIMWFSRSYIEHKRLKHPERPDADDLAE